ncbi:Myosin-J heavy chain [Hordeum vulgare]|nr:Myosin-J heavy chain [Hordeum vulgare]
MLVAIGMDVVEVEACVRRSEKRKAERFTQLMNAMDKKLALEERWTVIEGRKVALEEKRMKIAANAEDAKMLTLNVDSLDSGARVMVQSY